MEAFFAHEPSKIPKNGSSRGDFHWLKNFLLCRRQSAMYRRAHRRCAPCTPRRRHIRTVPRHRRCRQPGPPGYISGRERNNTCRRPRLLSSPGLRRCSCRKYTSAALPRLYRFPGGLPVLSFMGTVVVQVRYTHLKAVHFFTHIFIQSFVVPDANASRLFLLLSSNRTYPQ